MTGSPLHSAIVIDHSKIKQAQLDYKQCILSKQAEKKCQNQFFDDVTETITSHRFIFNAILSEKEVFDHLPK